MFNPRARTACLVPLLFLMLGACSRPDVDTTELIRPVRVMELKTSGSTFEESFSGQVQPRFHADLSFQVGGRLAKRSANVGDRVGKNEILATLDPVDLQQALQAAQAQLDAARAEQLQAKTDLDRAQSLRAQNFVSQAELDRRQLAFDAANSRLSQASAQFTLQRNQSQYGQLRAPNDGVVSAVYAEAGQVVGVGQPVLQWADERAVQVQIAVPESRVVDMKPGQEASVALWSVKDPLRANVREVSPVADPLTRTYAVYLDVQDPSKASRFGMSATVHFKKSAPSESFKLPITSLVAQRTGVFVWVFDETNGVVNKRVIQPFEVSESQFLVNEGLNSGELVVTAGTHVLNEGQRVRRFIEPGDLAK